MKIGSTYYNIKEVAKLSKEDFLKKYKDKVRFPERDYEEIQKAAPGKPKHKMVEYKPKKEGE